MPRLWSQMVIVLAVSSQAFAGDPQFARELTDKGIAAQTENDHVRALTLFEAALVEFDHPKIRYFRAKSMRAVGRLDDALREFEQIRGNAEVVKYQSEIVAFIAEITGDKERQALAAKLEAERIAREKLEAERQRLELQAERALVERMKRRKETGLYPPDRELAGGGAPFGRIVPLVPTFSDPVDEYSGAIEAVKYADSLGAYQTELTVSKAFAVASIAALSVGVGLGANPLSDGKTSDSVRQAGLAVGAVGVISGLVAIFLWPKAPSDAGMKPAAATTSSSRLGQR